MDTAFFPNKTRAIDFHFGNGTTWASDPKSNKEGLIAFWASSANKQGGRIEQIFSIGENGRAPALPDNWNLIQDFDLSNANEIVVSGNLVAPSAASRNKHVIQKISLDGPFPNRTLLEDSFIPSLHYHKGEGIVGGDPFTRFTFEYRDDLGMDIESLIDNELVVQGPHGLANAVVSDIQTQDGTKVRVTYAVMAPGGKWDHGDKGVYRFMLSGDQTDVAGKAVETIFGVNSFEVDLANQEYELKDKSLGELSVSVSDPTLYRLQTETHLAFVDLSSYRGDYPDGFRRVAINDYGHVAFTFVDHNNNASGDVIGYWNGTTTSPSFIEFNERIKDIELANNGRIVVSSSNSIHVFNRNLQEITQVGNPSHFDRIGDIDLSDDGRILAFSTYLTREGRIRYGNAASANGNGGRYQVFAAVLTNNGAYETRLMGTTLDGFQDSGEQNDRGALGFSYIHPTVSVASKYNINRSFTVAFTANAVYAIHGKVTNLRDFSIKANPALLVASQNRLKNGQTYAGADVSLKGSTYSFAVVRGRQWGVERKGFNIQPATFVVASGKLPKWSATYRGSKQHSVLETFAKGVAYWDYFRSFTVFERGSVLENQFVINAAYGDGTSDFEAIELLPFANVRGQKLNGTPVFAFRGTTPNEFNDWIADVVREGAGFYQFQRSKQWMTLRAKAISKDYFHPLTLTGHSLGGALVQWYSVQFTLANLRLREAVTFNSPGIKRSYAKRVRSKLIQQGLTHYISVGDIVSLAGDAFVEGQVFANYWFTLDPIAKHSLPLVANSIKAEEEKKTKSQGTIVVPVTKKKDGDLESARIPIDRLNSRFYTFGEKADFRTTIGPAVRAPNFGTVLAALMFSRGGIELARKVAGRYLHIGFSEIFKRKHKLSPKGLGAMLPRVRDFQKTQFNVFRIRNNDGHATFHRNFIPVVYWAEDLQAKRYEVLIESLGKKKEVVLRRTSRESFIDLARKLGRGRYRIRVRKQVKGRWSAFRKLQTFKIV